MLDPGAVTRLRGAIASVGGGYLRNPVRKYGVTCIVCLTPVAGFGHCYTCHAQRSHAGLADAIGFLTYAIAGTESGYVMRGYKARPPVAESRMIVGLRSLHALGDSAIPPGEAGRTSTAEPGRQPCTRE